MKKLIFKTLITFFLISPYTSHSNDNKPIIINATTNRNETNIGDYWLATDLEIALNELGYKTQTNYRGEYQNSQNIIPLLSIYMRGYTKFYPPFDKGYNILYLYYPMSYSKISKNKILKQKLNSRSPQPINANLDDDFQNYDLIATASPSYAKKLQENGINAIYTPQYTNPNKFYPNPDEKLKTDILFVGSNWHDRTSLRYAIESGFNVSVYGYNWQGIVPQEMYKASYISNTDLNRYYSSAKIVLNDHRPDMKKHGFINNRIYDATACGTLVISDYMPEIEKVYKNSIPMYKNKEDLKLLLDYYLTHEEERQKLAKIAQEITLKNFTHKAVAQKIINYTKKSLEK